VDELSRSFGALEGTVEAQGKRIDDLKEEITANNDATNQKLDRIISFQEQQRGAGRLGMWFAGGIGAIVSLAVSWFKS
jgi:hypothetical protein